MFRRNLLVCALFIAVSTPAARADVVLDWNNVWLDCIRATGGPPCPIARAGAMMHAAVYDAVNSIDRDYQPYLGRLHAQPNASPAAAAAVAAHDVLAALYPTRQSILDAALTTSLLGIPNGHDRDRGIEVGGAAAQRTLADRANDGSTDATPYVFGTLPGDWQLTPPDYSPPASPNWGHVKPWVIQDGAQFRPAGPLGFADMSALLASPGYAAIFNEVKSLGARKSAARTPYQTQTAYFWANDVNGTYKPPGHLNVIAQALSSGQGLTLSENARLFALLNISMAEAGMCAWDCKYASPIDFWRPVTGIRQADPTLNPLTLPDAAWLPLNAFTPPFPAYVSGHATFGAVAAAIFTRFFRTDHMTYSIGTDEPLYTGSPRTFNTFSEAALENGRSRIYLGVHWQFDADDGYQMGTALGNYIYEHALQPTHPVRHDGARFALHPNASGPGATVDFDLETSGAVNVSVFDVQGRRIATVSERVQAAGNHSIAWDGRDAHGSAVRSGIYFIRVETKGWAGAGKLLLLQ